MQAPTDLCKICSYPRGTMPSLDRKDHADIWICPSCGNQGDFKTTPFGKWELIPGESIRHPMAEVLETKAGG